MTVTGSSFTNNQAIAGNGQGGGGGYATGGALSISGGDPSAPRLTISQTVIQGNLVQAGSDSGGGFTNSAQGGGIYDSGAVLAISSSILSGNQAIGGSASLGASGSQGIGGALVNNGDSLTLKNAVIDG